MRGELYGFLRKKSSNKIDTNRYFITYADVITLLLGLFVILYASSKVDLEKYKEFSQAIDKYFKTPGEKPLKGGGGVLEGRKDGIPEPIFELGSKKSLDDIFSETSVRLKEYIDKGLVKIKKVKSGVVLTLPEKLLFKSGKATVQQKAMPALDTLASILRGIPFQITVDGHTDSDPIRTFVYESNWHLSVARATNVAYSLIERGAPEHNMVIRGFGSQRPIDENKTKEGKAKNRRVEISVTSLPPNAASKEGYKELKKNGEDN